MSERSWLFQVIHSSLMEELQFSCAQTDAGVCDREDHKRFFLCADKRKYVLYYVVLEFQTFFVEN